MKKYMFLLYFLVLIISLCGCNSDKNNVSGEITDGETVEIMKKDDQESDKYNNDLSYYCENVMKTVEGEVDVTYKFTLPNKKVYSIDRTESKVFLLVDGTFVSTVNLIHEDQKYWLSVKDLNDNIGIEIEWDNKNNAGTINVNDNVIKTSNIKVVKDQGLYINSDELEKIGYTITYIDTSRRLIGNNSILCIDSDQGNNLLSKTDAELFIRGQMKIAYDNTMEYIKDNDINNSIIEFIKEDMNKLNYGYSFSRYYEYNTNIYHIYLDRYTKEIYIQYNTIRYSKIIKVDISNPKIFEIGYLVG